MPHFDGSVKRFLIAFFLLLAIALIPQFILGQEELFLMINKTSSVVQDQFFYWITYFGDGLAFVIVIVILAYYSFRKALLGLVIFLLTSGVAQLLKRVLFDDRLRPFGLLGKSHELNIPEEVAPLVYNSFPSGHTTTAFALATFLVLIIKHQRLWPVLLVLAVLTGYSRIYLTHHFPVDVWVGSIIGTTGAILVYWWLDEKLTQRFGNRSLRSK
jgi:membrane-associated phospholipid phosphatase